MKGVLTMIVFVLLGYDEDWYTFETFMGVFSTKEKAEEFLEQDYTDYDGEKVFEHSEYKILEIPIDKFNSKCYNDYVRYKEIKI